MIICSLVPFREFLWSDREFGNVSEIKSKINYSFALCFYHPAHPTHGKHCLAVLVNLIM